MHIYRFDRHKQTSDSDSTPQKCIKKVFFGDSHIADIIWPNYVMLCFYLKLYKIYSQQKYNNYSFTNLFNVKIFDNIHLLVNS